MWPVYTLKNMARPTGLDGGFAASSSLRSSACRATASCSDRTCDPCLRSALSDLVSRLGQIEFISKTVAYADPTRN